MPAGRRGVSHPQPWVQLAFVAARVQPIGSGASRHAGARGRHGVAAHPDDTACQTGGRPTVRIGSENQASELSGVSVVASRYGRGDSAGVVAVIGPTRMDYSKVLRAVRIAGTALGDL